SRRVRPLRAADPLRPRRVDSALLGATGRDPRQFRPHAGDIRTRPHQPLSLRHSEPRTWLGSGSPVRWRTCCTDLAAGGFAMPEKRTIDRARRDKRQGKAPNTQAGEFVREEMEHVRQGKHGARSTKQAIAIGLSKARRAGVDLPPPARGRTSERTRQSAKRAYERGHGAEAKRKPSRTRSRAIEHALQREGKSAASHSALARQAHGAARRRTAAERSAAAKKASRTKGAAERHQAAMKAVHTKGHASLARAARKAARTRARKS